MAGTPWEGFDMTERNERCGSAPPRFPFDALERLILVNTGSRLNAAGQPVAPSRIVADALGTTLHQVYRWRRYGLDADQADRFAVQALKMHPVEVWPEFGTRECARARCTRRFVPRRRDQRFCSWPCNRSWWAAEMQRQRRARDPEWAERDRARKRAYYAECAETVRAKERRRYYARKAAV
jgi:hypothetical protein